MQPVLLHLSLILTISSATYKPCSDIFTRIKSPTAGELNARINVQLNRNEVVNFTHWNLEIIFTEPVQFNLLSNKLFLMQQVDTSSDKTPLLKINRPQETVVKNENNVKFVINFMTQDLNSVDRWTEISAKITFNIKFQGQVIEVSKVNFNNRSVCSDREVCGEFDHINDLTNDGSTVRQGDWPWLATLHHHNIATKQNIFFCGGTLVSDRHVITAAHCVLNRNSYCENVDRKNLIVILGMHDLEAQSETSRQIFNVSEIVVHNDWINFETEKNDGDIAVLLLSRPVTFTDFVKPACLNFNHQTNKRGKLIGWGLAKDDTKNNFPTAVTVPIVTTKTCRQSDERFTYVTSNRTFCSGLRNGSVPCSGGEIGGGFYTTVTSPSDKPRYVLTGVLSRTISNGSDVDVCDQHNFAVFSRLSSYKVWIEQDVGGIRANRLDEQKLVILPLHNAIENEKDKAVTQYINSNYPEALMIYNQVFEGSRCLLGDVHETTLNLLDGIADVLHRLDKHDEIIKIIDQMIEKQESSLGREHQDTLRLLDKKRFFLNSMSRYNDSLKLCNEIIKIQRQMLGEKHNNTVTSMNDKVTILFLMKRYDEAIQVINDVIKIKMEVLGETNEITLDSMNIKADILKAADRYNETVDIYDEMIRIRKQELGETHVLTRWALDMKAGVLEILARYDEALDVYDEIIKIRIQVFGETHADTLHAMNDKAEVLKKLGRFEESQDLFNKVDV